MNNCKLCNDSDCPYCDGPEADYHTACIDCVCVIEAKEAYKNKLKSLNFGHVPGGAKDDR